MRRTFLLLFVLVASTVPVACDDSGDSDTGTGQAVCGNGIVEEGEQCDGTNLDSVSCSDLGYGGGVLACTSECTFDTSGCSMCGNGVKEGDEECDGAEFAGLGCSDFTDSTGHVYDGGVLRCSDDCHIDTSGCGICGNGVIDGAEQCDGADLGGVTCSDLEDGTAGAFTDGTLVCTAECTFDVSACTRCGDGAVEGSEQCDGTSLDGMTCADLGYWDPHGSENLACSQQCGYDDSGCARPLDVCTGTAFGCTLLSDGSVWCWGQMGGHSVYVAREVILPTDATDLACGRAHACAVLADGTMYCWGDNSTSQCARSRDQGSYSLDSPAQVPGTISWSRVSAGMDTTCAIGRDSSWNDRAVVYCWGDNVNGQVFYTDNPAFDATVIDVPTPIKTDSFEFEYDAIDADVGDVGGCLVTSNHVAACWGTHVDDGALVTTEATQVDLAGREALGMHVEGRTACFSVRDATGLRVMCMGSNAVNVLGLEDDPDPADPLYISGISSLIPADVLLSAGYRVKSVVWAGEGIVNACILTDGDVWCWGNRNTGLLGFFPASSPYYYWQDVLLTDPSDIHSGVKAGLGRVFEGISMSNRGEFACAWDSLSIWCWGRNGGDGNLGTAASDPVVYVPSEVFIPQVTSD